MSGHGTINYVEIPVTDLARAAAFAETVFGWRVRRDDSPYWGFATGDDTDAGAFEKVDTVPRQEGGPLPYVLVDDLDKALAQVPEAGGSVDLGRTAIPGESGWYAHVRDPDGNRLGLWARR